MITVPVHEVVRASLEFLSEVFDDILNVALRKIRHAQNDAFPDQEINHYSRNDRQTKVHWKLVSDSKRKIEGQTLNMRKHVSMAK